MKRKFSLSKIQVILPKIEVTAYSDYLRTFAHEII